MRKISTLLSSLAIAAIVATPATAFAGGGKNFSQSKPFWTFAAPPPQGTTSLVRARHGLFAKFKTTGLTPGHAITLWIMFFDNPEACTIPGACDPDVDVGKPGVRFDFHYAGARIVRSYRTIFWGYLPANELSTSGWAELGLDDLVTPLTNPKGAQVIMALHSHGPAQRGRTLYEQLTSYLGGCELPLLGDASGFAQSASDIPALEGECSTIQVSFHNPPTAD